MNNDDIRQLATALKSLAESQQGIGGVVREQAASQHETNRMLGVISEQQAQIIECLRRSEDRHADSERAIRVVQADVRMLRSTQQIHGERLEKAESALRASKAQ